MARDDTDRDAAARGCCGFVVLIGLFCIVFFPAVCLHKISSTEAGVYYTGGPGSPHKLGGVAGPGLHSGEPFFSFIKFPTV
ncbi:hypothetical protein WJX72_002316 [[Myrmecia] bisecta]|uniref:Uncharacterized protein n=1 Tax=[Myrmecia] bisecta TaxID=41462 RepID=A0AAW1R5V1_9CHLO